MSYSHRQQCEAFHLLFLERLLKLADPKLFVLKGGVNLRFFHGSPRYSEDMDIDVLGGSVATLKKNGYRILNDRAFARALASFGIAELRVNDPARAKHTETTQRFRSQLITTAGEQLPTKVEFSRRPQTGDCRNDPVDPRLMRVYRRLSFFCQHYVGAAAIRQKVDALIHRSEPQVRDAFDLHVLWLGGHWDDAARPLVGMDIVRAQENLLSFSYLEYESQVLDYLEPETRGRFEGRGQWDEISNTLLGLLEREE